MANVLQGKPRHVRSRGAEVSNPFDSTSTRFTPRRARPTTDIQSAFLRDPPPTPTRTRSGGRSQGSRHVSEARRVRLPTVAERHSSPCAPRAISRPVRSRPLPDATSCLTYRTLPTPGTWKVPCTCLPGRGPGGNRSGTSGGGTLCDADSPCALPPKHPDNAAPVTTKMSMRFIGRFDLPRGPSSTYRPYATHMGANGPHIVFGPGRAPEATQARSAPRFDPRSRSSAAEPGWPLLAQSTARRGSSSANVSSVPSSSTTRTLLSSRCTTTGSLSTSSADRTAIRSTLSNAEPPHDQRPPRNPLDSLRGPLRGVRTPYGLLRHTGLLTLVRGNFGPGRLEERSWPSIQRSSRGRDSGCADRAPGGTLD
jgi:hypothetical protein